MENSRDEVRCNAMSPDEWRRIKEVRQEAVAYDAAARVAFLDRVCADNPELRRQVEELLAYDRRMGDFLEPRGPLRFSNSSDSLSIKASPRTTAFRS